MQHNTTANQQNNNVSGIRPLASSDPDTNWEGDTGYCGWFERTWSPYQIYSAIIYYLLLSSVYIKYQFVEHFPIIYKLQRGNCINIQVWLRDGEWVASSPAIWMIHFVMWKWIQIINLYLFYGTRINSSLLHQYSPEKFYQLQLVI